MLEAYVSKPFRFTDYERVASVKLRDADVTEICCAKGIKHDASLAAIAIAEDCLFLDNTFLGFVDGELFAIYGACSMSAHTSKCVWAVGTDHISIGGLGVIAWGIGAVDKLFELSPILENYVDARNEAHIQWLKGMRFTFTGLSTWIDGWEFKHFAKVRVGGK